jgi:hypothetical protein
VRIKTEYTAMGVFTAWDEDADAEAGKQGHGKSREEAVNNLVETLLEEERARRDSYAGLLVATLTSIRKDADFPPGHDGALDDLYGRLETIYMRANGALAVTNPATASHDATDAAPSGATGAEEVAAGPICPTCGGDNPAGCLCGYPDPLEQSEICSKCGYDKPKGCICGYPDPLEQSPISTSTPFRVRLEDGCIGEREGFDGLWLYREDEREALFAVRDLHAYEEDFVRRAYAKGREDATLCTPQETHRLSTESGTELVHSSYVTDSTATVLALTALLREAFPYVDNPLGYHGNGTQRTSLAERMQRRLFTRAQLEEQFHASNSKGEL